MSSPEGDPAKGLGYLFDEQYLVHDPGNQHPESPKRLVVIRDAIKSSGIMDRWQRVEPRLARIDELELVHCRNYIRHVEKTAENAPAWLDLDTAVSAGSYRTALLAAGGVLQCVDSICLGKLRRVFAFVRPPGHHADRGRACGFCLFNNIALAAAYARLKYKLERIAIVDIDVHHGNGTQSCFYQDPGVLYLSSHQFPFFPGTGDFDEIGEKEGKGYTLNFPLPEGTGESSFVPIYSKIASAVLDQFAPQLILVSAGFDGDFRDPLGGLTITHEGYASAAASLIRAAERSCEGRICFILEGGYSMQALRDCSCATMATMEIEEPQELPVRESSLFRNISEHPGGFACGCWKW